MIQNSIRMVPFSKTKISAKWSPHTTLHPWLWRWIGSWPTHGSYIPDQNYLTTSTPVFMCSLTYYLAVFVSWQCSVSPGVSARMNETSAVTIFEITELYESWALYWYTKGERDSNYRDRASKNLLTRLLTRLASVLLSKRFIRISVWWHCSPIDPANILISSGMSQTVCNRLSWMKMFQELSLTWPHR